jgi:hypothetical protein
MKATIGIRENRPHFRRGFRSSREGQISRNAAKLMQSSRMKLKLLFFSALFVVDMPAVSREQSLKIEGAPDPAEVAADAAGANGEIPNDLLDDADIHLELAVNPFTAPSISRIFDTLQFLMPLPIAEVARKMPARMSLDRADLAVELGFLIADGFLMVQSGQLKDVEKMAGDLTRYGKALGVGERVNRHAAGLLESAKKGDVAQLKMELSATQRDVEDELVTLKDADLAHLISLGGWIRALEVSSVAVDKQFSPERARKVMRQDIAEYYSDCITGLEPRISARPNYAALRDQLEGLGKKMNLENDQEPTPESMKEIRRISTRLVELALTRQE